MTETQPNGAVLGHFLPHIIFKTSNSCGMREQEAVLERVCGAECEGGVL